MKRNLVFGAAALGLIAAVAGWAAGPRTPASSGAATIASASPPSTAGSAKRGDDPFGGLDVGALASKLAAEKAAAGRSAKSAAKVFSAVEGALGQPLEGHLQVYAGGVGARYCERANTGSEVYVVVCEFAGEAEATKGALAGTSRAIPRREVVRVGDATVAIHRAGSGKATEADATRIRALVTKI